MTERPHVTEHAVLRWLERVEHVDIDALRCRLSDAAAIGIAHGSRSVIVGNGRLILRDRSVLTVTHRRDFAHLSSIFVQAKDGRR